MMFTIWLLFTMLKHNIKSIKFNDDFTKVEEIRFVI